MSNKQNDRRAAKLHNECDKILKKGKYTGVEIMATKGDTLCCVSSSVNSREWFLGMQRLAIVEVVSDLINKINEDSQNVNDIMEMPFKEVFALITDVVNKKQASSNPLDQLERGKVYFMDDETGEIYEYTGAKQ